MKIAVLGTGRVGKQIGPAWAKAGHEVVYGVRDPASKPADGGDYRSIAEAAAWAEVVVPAVPWHAIEATLAECGDLDGKLMIDPTNPLKLGADKVPELALGFDTSAGEIVQSKTKAKVVKSLNQVGSPVLGNTAGYGQKPIQFVASDHDDAKPVAIKLVEDLGFEVRDAGPMKSARMLEPLAMLYIDQVYRHGLDANRGWALLTRA